MSGAPIRPSYPNALLALVIVLSLLGGCRPSAPPAPKNVQEWFQQKMTHVNTEDGPIDVDSARDVGNDTIEYQTTKNGTRQTWRQKFRPTGGGQYERVGDPERVTAQDGKKSTPGG